MKLLKRSRKRRGAYIILWGALLVTVLLVWGLGMLKKGSGISQPAVKENKGETVSSPGEQMPQAVKTAEEEEMVGVWVPFMALVTAEKTEDAFKQNFDNIVKVSKDRGVNTLFVHVRPYSDALYKSEYFPWSHIITGEQGKDPGYDPLEYMVQKAHESGMKIHAWINPLRVKTDKTPEPLSADNVYNQLKADSPYYFMEQNGAIYLNPAYSYVRSLIANGAAEIVRNYDVDGIHFDDYFYPSGDGELDRESYEAYASRTEHPLPLEVWRQANINALIAEVYEKVKGVKPESLFGVSPAGNISYDYSIGADVATWCSTVGYIDYICPQIYYSFENAALGYSEALSQWMELDRHDALEVYIGLALYKAGTDADEGTWQLSNDIISRQIEEARAASCSGIILYSSEYLEKEETTQEVENAMAVLSPK